MSNLSNTQYFDITKHARTAKEAFSYGNTIKAKTASALIKKNILDKKPSDFKTTKDQGDALEEVVHYFLENSSVFQDVRRNDKNELHDLDHWANFAFFLSTYMPLMNISSMKFLGESKNYINSGLKVDIAYKLEGLKLLIGAGVGCYFTRQGLKGTNFGDSAKGVSRQFNGGFKNFSIVFVDSDWEFLYNNPKKFGALIYEKIMLCSNQNDTEKVDYKLV